MALHLGIDLGTTNSAAALFDGHEVQLVRAADGGPLTPSVVRIDAKGRVTVGARARRYLQSEPDDVRAEFKRLMGSPHKLAFETAGISKTPEELSAEVLRTLREDVRAQAGFLPERAVISVPALFELPQTRATSEAARLAGFAQVEMIQEPIASALAAGFRAEDSPLPWLVYDLGGGTLDVSLLETQDGLLRVIGHDGDNFLGGRDFDGAIVDWVLARIAEEHGLRIDRRDPGAQASLRRIRVLAEEVKIQLSRDEEMEFVADRLSVGDRSADVSLVLTRTTLEGLVQPLIDRSIDACRTLLGRHGIVPGADTLSRIVLVGGPTAMPRLRECIARALGAPLAEGFDPMTLVARGAALHAASSGLDARPAPKREMAKGIELWLQYPAMSADPTPYVVGKLVRPADRAELSGVALARADGSWSGATEAFDADGTFAAVVSLAPRTRTELVLKGVGPDGAPVAVWPRSIAIVHGGTALDPPLSRSIGIALASGRVHRYFDRGSPLPARRTFTVRTVATLTPDDPEGALRVPIVQGELPHARHCRLVGAIEIPARALVATVAAGTAIEVTVELDRGGRLAASARVSGTDKVFEGVAHLVAGIVPVEALEDRLGDLAARVASMRATAFREGQREVIGRLTGVEASIHGVRNDLDGARGGDADAAEKVRRALTDLDGLLATVEAEVAWPVLDMELALRVADTTSWVGALGTEDERKVLASSVASLEKARKAEKHDEITRHLDVIARLGETAYLRSPGAFEHQLDMVVDRIPSASDPKRARALLEEGRAAAARGDVAGTERAVRAIWSLLPPRLATPESAHGSGVR